MLFHTHTQRLPYTDALSFYRKTRSNVPSCLFESAAVSDKSSRMSVIGLEPSLELTGKDDLLEITLLHERGKAFFDLLRAEYAAFLQHETPEKFILFIPQTPFRGAEEARLDRLNIVQPLRRLLTAFQCPEKNFMGLYGAFAYRFVYQFEDIAYDKPCHDPDFHLFLFDNILLFNHLTQDLSLYVTRTDATCAALDAESLLQRTEQKTNINEQGLHIGEFHTTPNHETFLSQVARGVQLCHKGELLEIVLSRKLVASAEGDPFCLYERYKQINPSPYLFYFDFGNEVLLGASPEMMLRYEHGRATLRPISGSIRRAENPIEDHFLVMQLLNDPKENSELDMLIDLGRNDLARICKPGIEIDHYRIVEKYSHVTHTVAQVSGILEDRFSGFDALIASLNAGTLTGAPKIAAMDHIEQIEQHSRGYYGGCIGWLLFNGDVNTAITIRTAHIRDGILSYCTGATLLYESVPENELKETDIKAGAFQAATQYFQ